MASDAALALGSALTASLLTTLGSRWIVGVQTAKSAERDEKRREHERDLARRADERALRDARRERLWMDYVDVAFAADTIGGVAKELGLLWDGGPSPTMWLGSPLAGRSNSADAVAALKPHRWTIGRRYLVERRLCGHLARMYFSNVARSTSRPAQHPSSLCSV